MKLRSHGQRRGASALIIASAGLLASCGSPTATPTTTTTGHPGVGTTQPAGVGTTEPAGVGTTQPAGVGTTTTILSPLTSGTFSGFGSSLAQWATSHVMSTDTVVGASAASYWGPKTKSASVFTHQFVVLQTAKTRVIALEINFPSGTSVTTATKGVFSQLPPDAKSTSSEIISDDSNSNSCMLLTVKSPTLGVLLAGAPFNDPTGIVGVELATVLSATELGYSAKNINAAFLQLHDQTKAMTC